jgi:hypothetical protein
MQQIGPFGSAAAAAVQVGTRSVLNPMLWTTGITMTAGTLGSVFGPEELVAVFVGMPVATLTVTLFSYIWFMIKDPDRLQSEPFRIEQQVVQARIGDNRTGETFLLTNELGLHSANGEVGMDA